MLFIHWARRAKKLPEPTDESFDDTTNNANEEVEDPADGETEATSNEDSDNAAGEDSDEDSGADENPAVDPDTGVEIFNPETIEKVAEILIPNVVVAANDISDDVKAIIGEIF